MNQDLHHSEPATVELPCPKCSSYGPHQILDAQEHEMFVQCTDRAGCSDVFTVPLRGEDLRSA